MSSQVKFDLVLAARLKEFCESEIGGQKEVAKFLKRDQAVISKMYRGIYGILDKDIQKLVKEKGMNSAWYYTGTPPAKLNEPEKKNLTVNVVDMKLKITTLESQVKYLTKLVFDLQEKVRILEGK